MGSKRSSFEVHVYQADHWVLESLHDREERARDQALRLLSIGRAQGVRILRDWKRHDGSHSENEIFVQFRSATRHIQLPEIEDPAICREVEDFYRVDSRITMTRLIRPYLDQVVLTPTELLHHHPELRRLLDSGVLIGNALQRIAVAQTALAGGDPADRRELLRQTLEGLAERARLAWARPDLEDLGRLGLAPLYDQLSANASPEEVPFLTQVLLCRRLAQIREWLPKLDRLLDLVETDGPCGIEVVGVLDSAIADVIGSPEVMQTLLGFQRNLATALVRMIDLAEGRLETAARGVTDRAFRLGEALASDGLFDSRTVLFDLVRRQLRGTQPLMRADPEAERDGFDQVRRRLCHPEGILGGPGMAEALTLRFLRFLEAGGAAGRRQAIAELVEQFGGDAARIRYLLVLAESDLGRQHRQDVVAHLTRLTTGTSAAGLITPGKPIRDSLEAIATLHEKILASALPDAVRARIAGNLDSLLAATVGNPLIVEQFDDPTLPPNLRVQRLIEMCIPGTLRSPQALASLRRGVLEYLRRNQFDVYSLADHQDPRLKEAALRDLYDLLGRAGFTQRSRDS